MADVDPDVAENVLARLRERMRGRYPHERLILCVDGRHVAGAPERFTVIAVDRSSAWYELLPPEQIVTISGRIEDAPLVAGDPAPEDRTIALIHYVDEPQQPR